MSFKVMIICSAFIAISCGKEFILLSGAVGSSDADVSFMDALCAASGAEPASIESAEENAQVNTLCAAGPGEHCFIGLVRDDPTTTDWYWRDGAAFEWQGSSYSNWVSSEGVAQGPGGEQCVVFHGGGNTWHDYPCSANMDLICQKYSGCAAVDIDGYLMGCSDEFALTNTNVADNEGRISDNEIAIQANTDLINTKSAGYTAEFEYINERFEAIATFQAAHAGPAVVDEFGSNTSFFNSNNSFLLMSLLVNVFLVLSSCYMVNKSRKGGYNKVKMYNESEVDVPFK